MILYMIILGDDVFYFNKGDGQDVWDIYPRDGSITIKFGEGIKREDLIFEEYPNGLLIKIANTEDSILLDPTMYYNYKWYGDILLSQITMEFSDGSKLTSRDLLNQFAVSGTSKDDNLYGTEDNDILIGAQGNDIIHGKVGDDIYVFNPGDGRDIIIEEEGEDKLFFDIDKEKVVIFKDGDDLVVGYSENDFVRVINQFKGETYDEGIEKIQVKDGFYITRWDVENIINAMIDFNSNNEIDYTQKYNELINNQQYMSLIIQSWQKIGEWNVATCA